MCKCTKKTQCSSNGTKTSKRSLKNLTRRIWRRYRKENLSYSTEAVLAKQTSTCLRLNKKRKTILQPDQFEELKTQTFNKRKVKLVQKMEKELKLLKKENEQQKKKTLIVLGSADRRALTFSC